MTTDATNAAARSGRLLAAGLIGLMLVAVAPGAAPAHEGHAALPSTGAKVEGDRLLLSAAAEKAIGLQTAKVTLGNLERVLRVNARVELPWDRQALVTTLTPGRVEVVLVKPGEAVRAGQELARLESLELEDLQLDLLQAAEEVQLAERLEKQREELAETGAIARKSLLEARTELRQKTARLNIALRKLQALGLAPETLDTVRATGRPVRSISIRSPISGVVLHSDVRAGEFVETTQHLFNIVDRSSLWIVGDVLETDMSAVRTGQPVEVRLSARRMSPITGVIGRIELKLDEAQRTLGVVVPVGNPHDALRPGMFGRMAIKTSVVRQAVVCPADALIGAGNRTFVLVRQGDGKYQRKPVQTGLRTGDRVEVVGGVFPGQQVIVVGTQLLGAMFHADRGESDLTPVPGRRQPARTTSSEESKESSSLRPIAVAHASVEIPTDQQASAASAIEGRIVSIHVHPGQPVKAGQVLAELDSQELRGLHLDLLQAQERLRWAQQTLDRLEPLAGSGAVPAEELWQQRTEQRTLSQRVASLTRKLELIGISAAEIDRIRQTELTGAEADDPAFLTAPVRASIDGRIAEFGIVPGQIVRSDAPLFEIQDLGTVWIRGYVAERDASAVQVGQGAKLTFPARPDLRLTGSVVRLAPTLHATARVLPVWVDVENPDDTLRGGLFARIEITPSKRAGAVAARSVQP